MVGRYMLGEVSPSWPECIIRLLVSILSDSVNQKDMVHRLLSPQQADMVN